MPAYNDQQKREITFLNGLNNNGAVATDSYATRYNDTPTKWENGVIRYVFSDTSQFTPIEKDAMVQSMAIWSGVANVTFVQVSSIEKPTLTILAPQREKGPVNNWDIADSKGAFGTSVRVDHDPAVIGSSALPYVKEGVMYMKIKGLNSNGLSDGAGDTDPLGNANYGTGGNDGPYAVTHELGHVLELGHGGPYNNTATGSNQYGPYDMSQWTIMSYMYPSTANLKYKDSLPTVTKEAYWNSYRATTPMELDVAAAQQVYGNPITKTFAGNNVFGYNSNIKYTTLSNEKANIGAYDFSINKLPVISIWDSGKNNTLDLSEDASGVSINLNPGAFSSTAGLKNNIGIDQDTRIDKAIGGSGDDTFTLNVSGDIIDGKGGDNTVIINSAKAGYSLSKSDNGTVTVTNGDKTDILLNIKTIKFVDFSVDTLTISVVAAASSDMASVVRLFEAAVDRQPEGAGLNYWVQKVQAGASLTDIAVNMVECQEFNNLYGDVKLLSPTVYISELYANVLHREGSHSDINYWVSYMAAGATPDQVLINFATCPENINNTLYVQNLHQASTGTWMF